MEESNMILHLEEFKEIANPTQFSIFKKLHEYPKYVHEMTEDELKTFITDSQSQSAFAAKKGILRKYLKWLFDEHNIDTRDLFMQIKRVKADLSVEYFYDLESFVRELTQAIAQAEFDIETTVTHQCDFQGLQAFYLLSWYGIEPSDFVSIKLSDVNDRDIYIPTLKKHIVVDKIVADIINEYKNTTGRTRQISFIPYTQNTLFRNLDPDPISKRTIDNIKGRFYEVNDDKRFRGNIVETSGKFYRLVKLEEELGRDLTDKDAELINQYLNESKVKVYQFVCDFEKYKEQRNEYLCKV